MTKVWTETGWHRFFVVPLLLLALFATPVLADDDDDDDDDDVKVTTVKCDDGDTLRKALRDAKPGEPLVINIEGVCDEDVSITKDDITLSGNEAGVACNKASPGGTGTIDGTVTVDGVRATIEFLTITGSGAGVDIVNRATVRLVCNDISDNEAYGVAVLRSSNAVLRDNMLSGNGTRTADPTIFFDCGLFAEDASSVDSKGNTYADNQYCGIDIGRQSSFRNGAFQPVESGHPANPDERDVFTELGCTPGTGAGCFTTDQLIVAIDVFNNGLVDIRNADVNGEIDINALSSFRVDGDAAVKGNINAAIGSIVRFKDRSSLGDRVVTYTGTLTCFDTSQTFFSNVQCGQMCSGAIPGSCVS